MMIPARMTPWPPSPPILISVGPMLFSRRLGARLLAGRGVRDVLGTEGLGEPLLHRLLERGSLTIDELADDDLVVEVERDLARVGAVLHHALLLVVLHLLQALAQPVAAQVERRAGGDDLDEAEALLVQGLAHRLGDLLHVVRGPARHVDRTARVGEVREVERLLVRAIRRGGGDRRERRGRGDLTARHTVREVVHAHDEEIGVAAGRVDEVVAADGGEVTVAGVDHHLEVRSRELEAGRERNGAAVRGVERVEVQVPGDAPGAADAAHDGDLVEVELRLGERAREAVDGRADATARAPDARQPVEAEVLVDGVLAQDAHRTASRIASAMTSGVWTVPPAWSTGIVRQRPAASRSTSSDICPMLSSGTTKAFTFFESSTICFSGNGQAVMSRNEPTLAPFSRASCIPFSAMREVIPKLTTTASAPERFFSSKVMILSAFSTILANCRFTILSCATTFIAGEPRSSWVRPVTWTR